MKALGLMLLCVVALSCAGAQAPPRDASPVVRYGPFEIGKCYALDYPRTDTGLVNKVRVLEIRDGGWLRVDAFTGATQPIWVNANNVYVVEEVITH